MPQGDITLAHMLAGPWALRAAFKEFTQVIVTLQCWLAIAELGCWNVHPRIGQDDQMHFLAITSIGVTFFFPW